MPATKAKTPVVPFPKRVWRRVLPFVGRWPIVRSLIDAHAHWWHRRNDPKIIRDYLEQIDVPRLHLGCGPHHLASWLNSDLHAYAPGVVEIDASRRFPLPDQAFMYVFTEHMVEHIPLEHSLATFKECFRVLKIGGTLRVSTPDLAFLAALANQHLSRLQEEYIEWSCRTYVGAAKATPAIAVNNFVRNWGHVFIYDRQTLQWGLNEAGFKKIVFCALHKSEHAALRGLENDGRLPKGFVELESIIVEATKI